MSEQANRTARPPRGPMGRGHRGTGEKPKDFKGTIGKLIAYIGRYKFAVLAVLIFAVGSTIFDVVGPKILGKATTAVFEGLTSKVSGLGGIDFDKIGKILLFLLGLYILSTCLLYTSRCV